MNPNQYKGQLNLITMLMLIVLPGQVAAYVSGSSGVDGALNVTTNTQLQLPPSGIFNYTDVTIAAGATLTFAKNANNTPVTILASGDVTIDGTINVNGSNGGNYGNGSPGVGGPGGYNGGRAGFTNQITISEGGNGQGPGRGTGGRRGQAKAAGGGGFGTDGSHGECCNGNPQGKGGPSYGNAELLPLIGGSGGGGGSGGNSFVPASGGGGGGGALLIAASGTITVTGSITARGGAAGVVGCCSSAGSGGSGSGGAIRLVATTIQGNGTITAEKRTDGTDGGEGRIRLETENLLRTSNTTPTFSFLTQPQPLLLADVPSIRISSVGGIAAPGNPTGDKDIVLPGFTTNPVPVEFETAYIPLGTTLILTSAPVRGTAATANSTPVAGTLATGTASANINMSGGNNILTAQTTFTVTASLGQDFSNYAQGEQVEKIKVAVTSEGQSETTFITVSGREYTWPSNTVAMR